MNLYFSNPLGWLGLFALGPLVYLHFFRRQTRRRVVNTLFLLERDRVQRAAGDKFSRWRQSPSFWLQALGILVLCWILSGPRWAHADAVGQVGIVLDGSASMSAFRLELEEALDRVIELAEGRLDELEYSVFDSADEGRLLCRGREPGELRAALSGWKPSKGALDPIQALEMARAHIGEAGVLLYLSDHYHEELPVRARCLAIGRAVENVGVSGMRAHRKQGELWWQARIKNYGAAAAKRNWRIRFGEAETPPALLSLEPGESLLLEGRFPEGSEAIALELDADAFAFDDYMPLVVERPKLLLVRYADDDPQAALFQRLADALPLTARTTAPDAVALVFETVSSLEGIDTTRPGARFVDAGSEAIVLPRGSNTPSHHSFNRGLSWGGLLVRSALASPEESRMVETLLWREERPLISLVDESLVFWFSPELSNLDRLPAFALLVNRYTDWIRSRQPGTETRNCDTGQDLGLSPAVEAGTELLLFHSGRGQDFEARVAAATLKAPELPSFFRVEGNGVYLFEGAAQFVDTRESDFRAARTNPEWDALDVEIVESYFDDDLMVSLWLLALGAILLGAWRACYKENL